MAPRKAQDWANAFMEVDEEMTTPTPRERQLAELAEKDKAIEPKRYDISSRNTKALRVVYDFGGRSVAIRPGETKRGVLMHPNAAERLGRGDLEFQPTKE